MFTEDMRNELLRMVSFLENAYQSRQTKRKMILEDLRKEGAYLRPIINYLIKFGG